LHNGILFKKLENGNAPERAGTFHHPERSISGIRPIWQEFRQKWWHSCLLLPVSLSEVVFVFLPGLVYVIG
jgi:hypothetical protein